MQSHREASLSCLLWGAQFALAFGQVEAALVTEGSLRVLKKLQPSALDTMREIYRTPKILRAPLVAFGPQANGSLKKVMIAAFLDFSKDDIQRMVIREVLNHHGPPEEWPVVDRDSAEPAEPAVDNRDAARLTNEALGAARPRAVDEVVEQS